MAVNRTRDMEAELHLGLVENSYIRLDPNRGGVIEHDKEERRSWPTMARADAHPHNSHACNCAIGIRNSNRSQKHDPRVAGFPLLGTYDPPGTYY